MTLLSESIVTSVYGKGCYFFLKMILNDRFLFLFQSFSKTIVSFSEKMIVFKNNPLILNFWKTNNDRFYKTICDRFLYD